MATKTLMTAAEFAKTGPETDGFELVRGELMPMPPARRRHGRVCGRVAFLLGAYRQSRGCGEVLTNDAGIITEHDPDTVRGIDAAFYLNPPPDNSDADKYCDVPPDLAVEVRSEGQAWKELLAKMHEYVQMGARMVWIVDPGVRRLTVFEPEREPITYAAENEFDGGDILPGLRFKVAELFVT
jgi:Uma2 family endonuclease